MLQKGRNPRSAFPPQRSCAALRGAVPGIGKIVMYGWIIYRGTHISLTTPRIKNS